VSDQRISLSLTHLRTAKRPIRRGMPEAVLSPIWGQQLNTHVIRRLWLRAVEEFDMELAQDLLFAMNDNKKMMAGEPRYSESRLGAA